MSRRERLVVVCGLPGAGKTTVSRGLAERIDRVDNSGDFPRTREQVTALLTGSRRPAVEALSAEIT